jgi:antitoxin component YwqK of YwqJK toxin-antitoxin module
VNQRLHLLLICLLSALCFSQHVASQSATTEDSIPLYLTPPPSVILAPNVYPFRLDSIGCIVPPIIYPPIDWWHIGNIGTICVWAAPTCGDTYQPNGKLSSHIECENGIQHGKTQYFDEKGRKTSESYFIHGKQISSKSFDAKGKLLSWANYDANGELHGYNYSWDEYNGTKIITRYAHGIEHGVREEYNNGVLNLEQVYEHGDVTKQTYYFENKQVYQRTTYLKGQIILEEIFREDGSVSSYALNDSLGHRVLDYTKNERGVMTSERHYQNNHPIGTTLESYDDQTGYRMTVDYQNGLPLASYERHGAYLYRVKHFTKGLFDSLITFHVNGDTSELLTTGNIWRQQKWDTSGKQTDDYRFYNDIFYGSGYFTLSDTTYKIEASADPNTHSYGPIKRWVMYKSDTLRLDYMYNNKNSVDRSYPYVLRRNHFRLDSATQHYVRDGQWLNYEGNIISEVINYRMGILHGRYLKYAATEPPIPIITGQFNEGKKDGLWVLKESQTEIINYRLGIKHGLYRRVDSQNVVLENGEFRNGCIVGDYTTYYANSSIQSVVSYSPGQEIGYQKIYDQFGRLFSEGPVQRVIDQNPEPRHLCVGKWIFYRYKSNGKAKKEVVKYGKIKASQSRNPSDDSLPDSLQSHFPPSEAFHQILSL